MHNSTVPSPRIPTPLIGFYAFLCSWGEGGRYLLRNTFKEHLTPSPLVLRILFISSILMKTKKTKAEWKTEEKQTTTTPR